MGLLLIIILLILFGFGGGYYGYRTNPSYGFPYGLGTILVILLIIWLFGGFGPTGLRHINLCG